MKQKSEIETSIVIYLCYVFFFVRAACRAILIHPAYRNVIEDCG